MNRVPTLSRAACPSCGDRQWYMYVVTKHGTDSVTRSVPIVDWMSTTVVAQAIAIVVDAVALLRGDQLGDLLQRIEQRGRIVRQIGTIDVIDECANCHIVVS